MYIKNIILNIPSCNQRAICKLEKYSNNVILMIENFPNNLCLNTLCVCIFYPNGQMDFYNLTNNKQTLYCSITKELDFNQSITLAIASFSEKDFNVLAYNNSNNTICMLNAINNKTHEILKELIPFSEKSEAKTQSISIEETDVEETANNENIIPLDNNAENEINSADSLTFYKQIEHSINSLLQNNPKDETLENAIEHSSFVKIMRNDQKTFHSIGIIYTENNDPEYICFALPCTPNSPPPQDMEKYAQFLIVDENTAYYLMYQKASNGESIVINQ